MISYRIKSKTYHNYKINNKNRKKKTKKIDDLYVFMYNISRYEYLKEWVKF